MTDKKLTFTQKDFLKEIGNIAAGNATTAMSSLINERIMMDIPTVKMMTINELMDELGGPEKLVVTNFFRISGEIPGTVYFVLTIEEAEYLVKKMTMDETIKLFDNEDDIEPNEMAISVLEEISNIITGSYLSAISDFTNIKMIASVPYLSIDMAAATLVTGLIELSNVSDYAITIESSLADGTEKGMTSGQFLLIPDPPSIPKLFKALGIEENE